MNILITGAKGFIGQALCNRLMADGYQVRGAVRAESQMTALPSGVEGAMVGDIGPETDWSDALSSIEGIVHLAARVHVMRESAADPLAAFREVNVEGTKCLAIAAANAGVKRLVYISTVKVNGERTRYSGQGIGGRDQKSEVRSHPSTIVPTHGAGGVKGSKGGGQEGELKEAFSEKDVPEPQDPYAVSKWEAERALKRIARETGLELIILRPPLVYGPFVKANFLRLLQIVKMGIPLPLASVRNRRSLIYLENLVDVIIICIIHPKAAGETFMVSDSRDLSTPELIRMMAEAMGRKASLFSFSAGMLKAMGKITGKSAEIDRLIGSLCVDSGKIRRMLGWNPPFTVEEGFKETAEWYTKKMFDMQAEY